MEPVLIHLYGMIPLLEKQDVSHNIRARIGTESVVGEPNRTKQLSPLGQVLSHGRISLVHGPAGGNERHHAPGADFIHGFGQEIVVDQKVVFVVPLVRHAVIAEGHVAYGDIEEAVWERRVFKAVDLDVCFLVELLGDPAGQVVQLHAVQLAVCHALGEHSEEVTDAAGGFQYIPGPKTHAFNSLVHCPDDDRRGVVRVQGGCPGGPILRICQQLLQLGVFPAPLGFGFVEGVRQAAPAHILRQDFLLLRRRQTVFGFDLFQRPDRRDVPLVFLFGPAFAQVIVRDAEVEPLFRYRYR